MSAFRKEQEELYYRIYVTDALKVLTENTSKTIVNGASLVHRYADLLQEIRSNVQGSDERADQKANSIVNDIKDKLSRG